MPGAWPRDWVLGRRAPCLERGAGSAQLAGAAGERERFLPVRLRSVCGKRWPAASCRAGGSWQVRAADRGDQVLWQGFADGGAVAGADDVPQGWHRCNCRPAPARCGAMA